MSGLFGGGAPKVEKPAKMPDPDDPTLIEQRRRQGEAARVRSGRESTILSESLRDDMGVEDISAGELGA